VTPLTGGEDVYLRPDVVMQPLVDRWYAWSHLVPPCTLALNHLERHLRIMDSYVDAPEVHAAAAADPMMAGGPFIDLDGERSDDVKALAEHIRRRRAGLLALGPALRDLSELLATNARGYSLDSLYAEVPPVLRGYVELFYDVEDRAGFRLLEPLLYAGPHGDADAQSVAVFAVDEEARPFVLSTPSLDGEDRVHLDLPFASPEVDHIARLRTRPRPWGEVAELLDDGVGDRSDCVRGLVTTTPPRSPEPYTGPGLRWRYFGHACVLVEAGGVSVLTDPLVAYGGGGSVPRYTLDDLPETVDALLITHAHQDHTMLETLLQLRHRARLVVVPRSGGGSLQDPSLALLLRQVGFEHVVEVDTFDDIDLGPLVVRPMPFFGEHSDLDIRSKTTYVVEAAGRRLFFASDTCNVEPAAYRHVRDHLGDVDTVFLGMECSGAPLDWLYGPLLMSAPTAESRRMARSRTLSGSDSPRAIELVRALGASRAFVYSMGQEPWLRYLLALAYEPDSRPIVESDRFVAWCHDHGIESRRLFGRHEVCLP
jgi:L-ascorbate metabolism protein UlaG (beta-lactamase superfamily)